MFAFFYNCVAFIFISFVLRIHRHVPSPTTERSTSSTARVFLRWAQTITFTICYVNTTNSSKSNKADCTRLCSHIKHFHPALQSQQPQIKKQSMYPSDKPGHSTRSTDCRVNSSCGWSCSPAAWTGPCLPIAIAQSPSSDSAFVNKQRSLCSEVLRGVPSPSCLSCVTPWGTRMLYYIMQEGCLITVLVWI